MMASTEGPKHVGVIDQLSRINLCISLVYFLSSLLKMHGPKNKKEKMEFCFPVLSPQLGETIRDEESVLRALYGLM